MTTQINAQEVIDALADKVGGLTAENVTLQLALEQTEKAHAEAHAAMAETITRQSEELADRAADAEQLRLTIRDLQNSGPRPITPDVSWPDPQPPVGSAALDTEASPDA